MLIKIKKYFNDKRKKEKEIQIKIIKSLIIKIPYFLEEIKRKEKKD